MDIIIIALSILLLVAILVMFYYASKAKIKIRIALNIVEKLIRDTSDKQLLQQILQIKMNLDEAYYYLKYITF